MNEGKEKKSRWKKLWEILQTVGAGAGLVALKGVIENASEKAGKVVGKKLEETLGLSAEEAEKTMDDEIMFEKAILGSSLASKEKRQIWDYLGRLRDKNPRLACEWVRWVHNAMIKLGRPIKPKKKNQKKGQGNQDDKGEKEILGTDYSDAISVVESLFMDIVVATDDDSRNKALKLRNIQVKEKVPSPIVEKSKNFGKKVGEKIVTYQKANFADFENSAGEARAKAKQRLKDAIEKRRTK